MENKTTNSHLTIYKWVLFTTLGWFIGLFIALMIAELLEKINLDFFGLGLGISIGIGLMQWLILKRHTKINHSWFLNTVAGLSISFLLLNIIIYILKKYGLIIKMDGIPAMIAITLAVAIGGALIGYFQSNYLKNSYHKPINGLIKSSFIAWTTCSVFISVYFIFMNYVLQIAFTDLGKILNLFVFILIGPILGFMSGKKSLLSLIKQ